ncbi:Amidase [Penicillium brevicompactum]
MQSADDEESRNAVAELSMIGSSQDPSGRNASGGRERYRWETGAAVSEEQHKDAVQRMEIYKAWLLTAMRAESTSEAEPLVVLPIGNVAPNYRDEPSPSPRWQSALDQLSLPPILGTPDIAIPIGEVPYESKITK